MVTCHDIARVLRTISILTVAQSELVLSVPFQVDMNGKPWPTAEQIQPETKA